MDETFQEVHRSNMSKTDKDKQPVFREDGKIIKSELYSPPDLESILVSHGYKNDRHRFYLRFNDRIGRYIISY